MSACVEIAQLRPYRGRFQTVNVLCVCVLVSFHIATMDQVFYVKLVNFMLRWRQLGSEEDQPDKAEQLESMRECFRSILGKSGVHRLTILAECWCVLTSCKLFEDCCPAEASQIPISSAAPAPVAGDLHVIGWLPHASILEEELCGAMDLVESLQQYAELEGEIGIGQWLADLRFVASLAHFCVHHRVNRDA